MNVRPAEPEDLDALAAIWHEAWHDSHASLVPAQLTQVRTLDEFRRRLALDLALTRTIGPVGQPMGFCVTKGDELYQLFIANRARGSGVAASLIADAEDVLHARGVSTAWLACAVGNDRAARFYEKNGWHRTATATYPAETREGPVMVDVWRYEKNLGRMDG